MLLITCLKVYNWYVEALGYDTLIKSKTKYKLNSRFYCGASKGKTFNASTNI